MLLLIKRLFQYRTHVHEVKEWIELLSYIPYTQNKINVRFPESRGK